MKQRLRRNRKSKELNEWGGKERELGKEETRHEGEGDQRNKEKASKVKCEDEPEKFGCILWHKNCTCAISNAKFCILYISKYSTGNIFIWARAHLFAHS